MTSINIIKDAPKKYFSSLEGFLSDSLSRNEGYFSKDEMASLSQKKVAIPGLGGVGGLHLISLLRSGICDFNVSDFDNFEPANSNRQYGAKSSNYFKKKSECMLKEAIDINPFVSIKSFPEGINENNMHDFLKGVDLLIDGLDVFTIDLRIKLFELALNLGIPVVTAAPLGFGSSVISFSPNSKQSFRELTCIKDSMSKEDKLIQFISLVSPDAFHKKYLLPFSVNLTAEKVPSLAIGCQMATTLATTQSLKILLKRNGIKHAPNYFAIDPYLGISKKSIVRFGNKNPLQKLKIKIIKHMLNKNKIIKHKTPALPLDTKNILNIDKKEIDFLIQAGLQAPSGENRQPWKFTYIPNGLLIFLDEKADCSFFNMDQKASYISFGAVIENIKIAASAMSIKVHTKKIDPKNQSSVHLIFEREDIDKDHLVNYIWERNVNRKRYKKVPLENFVVNSIKKEIKEFPNVKLSIIQDKTNLFELGRISEEFAEIRHSIKDIHNFLHSNIHAKYEDALKYKTGFPIDNLESGVLGNYILQKTKPWKTMSFLNKLGFNKIIAKKTEEGFKHCSACLLLSVPNFSDDAYLEGGRALQRLWLKLSNLGISMQPMTTINFFHYRYSQEKLKNFEPKYHKTLEKGFDDFNKVFPNLDMNKNGQIMLMRIGYTTKIKTWTLRKEIEDVLINP